MYVFVYFLGARAGHRGSLPWRRHDHSHGLNFKQKSDHHLISISGISSNDLIYEHHKKIK